MHIGLGDRKNSPTYSSRRKRICRQASGFGVDWMSSLQRLRQRRRGEWLNANDFNAVGIPRSNPGDKATAADGHEDRVDIWSLFIKLHADGALPKHGLILVERVNRHRWYSVDSAANEPAKSPAYCDDQNGTRGNKFSAARR
jgi:hypothetical protein